MSDAADAEATIRDYYEALRRGEPLYPYFAERESTAKFGVEESLFGYDAVAEGLREQTRVTEEWAVESHRLSVDRAGEVAWFSDVVSLSWTADGERRSHPTRWSGSLERRDEEWVFTQVHVSVAHDPATGTAVGSLPEGVENTGDR
jgi:ketosteroid isomerase-like protein